MVWPFSSSERTPHETATRDKLALEKEDHASSAASKDLRTRKLMEAINENCALESLALIDCQDSWSLWNRVNLCQGTQKNYMECLNMQRTLLLQMGFGREGNTAQDDELIKWHADELYQKHARERDAKKTEETPKEQ